MNRQLFDLEAANRQLMSDEAQLLFLGMIDAPSEYHEVTEETEYLLEDESLADDEIV